MPSSIIAAIIIASLEVAVTYGAVAAAVATAALSFVISTVIARVFSPSSSDGGGGGGTESAKNPGTRQQLPPAGNNKVPVLYGGGEAGYGGVYLSPIITELILSNDNKTLAWVATFCERTGGEYGTPDTFSFGKIYWGGRECVFNGTAVTGLIDPSTGETDSTIDGNLNIYTFVGDSFTPQNGTQTAVQLLSRSDFDYKWDATKKMNNSIFIVAILKYSQKAGTTGLQEIKAQITNSRYKPGDVILDYMRSSRYGCGLPISQIDTDSLTALNTYCAQSVSYTDYNGVTQSLSERFRLDGVNDPNSSCQQNLQLMVDSCGALLTFDQVTGKYRVVVQSNQITPSMNLTDTNLVGALVISYLDLTNTSNIITCQYPGEQRDSFAAATFDLRTIAPNLLSANEPINSININLYYLGGPLASVRAQLLGNRFLKEGRQDLQVQAVVNYSGAQLVGGDFVTLTNANYGFNQKLFRVMKVNGKFDDTQGLTASLSLQEADPATWDDVSVKQFTPSPNSSLQNSISFGSILAPVVSNPFPTAVEPNFTLTVGASSGGIVQYANIYYSASNTVDSNSAIYLSQTAIAPAGNPFANSLPLPQVVINNLPAGDWYLYSQMVNSIAKSGLSAPSSLLKWRPTTITYTNQYLAVAYADTATGTGLSLNPTGKSFYSLVNQSSRTFPSAASFTIWFAANPTFGTQNYLLYQNLGSRSVTFATGLASAIGGSGPFVPSNGLLFDVSKWSGLNIGSNIIDLDIKTGAGLTAVTTSSGVAAGQLSTLTTADNRGYNALDIVHNFGGASQRTITSNTYTIDQFGRILGFTPADAFYYTQVAFTAGANQTVFNVTRDASFVLGQTKVSRNGILLDSAEYTETLSAITLANGCALGEIITIESFRATASADFNESLSITVASVSGNSVVFASLPSGRIVAGNKLVFGTLLTTSYTVSAVNLATSTITFSSAPTASIGDPILRRTVNNASYTPFARFTYTISNTTNFTMPDAFLVNGREQIYLNGALVNDLDYDLTNSTGQITLSNSASGLLTIFLFAANSFGQAAGSSSLTSFNAVANETTYAGNFDPTAFSLFINSVLQQAGVDYTASSSGFVLANALAFPQNILSGLSYTRTGSA